MADISPNEVVWSDINEALITDSQGRVKRSLNVDSVRTSIDNILRTYQGERVMLPEFASKLKALVFEPIDDTLATLLSDEVKRVIEQWDDRVKVQGIDYQAVPDNNYVSLVIRFVIRGYSEVFTNTLNITL